MTNCSNTDPATGIANTIKPAALYAGEFRGRAEARSMIRTPIAGPSRCLNPCLSLCPSLYLSLCLGLCLGGQAAIASPAQPIRAEKSAAANTALTDNTAKPASEASADAPPTDTTPPRPFEAKMAFLRNGKPIGEAQFAFTVTGDEWTLRSSMRGTRGVAKFLGVEESSESHGRWIDGAPQPLNFRQTVEVAIKTIETRADFDWQAGTVLSVHEDGETTLPATPGLLDPVSVGLAVRAGLGQGEREWRLPMVDEDEIEVQHFRAVSDEALETGLGCLETVRVDKIRAPGSTRYTRTWYARDLAWVPVHVAHGKTDGDQMETRLVALSVAGETVSAGPACPG